jgi:DHA2 family multidrug resistance protein-like MFS transporter
MRPVASVAIPFRPRSRTTSSEGGAAATLSPGRVLAVVAGGYFLASWAMNPVSSVLPTITRDLDIDVTRAAWIMNAYFLALVGWVLVAGRAGDAFGHGSVFRLGCATFAVGSLIAAVPAGFPLLVLARAVQGLGSAMLFGTSLAIIASAFPGKRLAWGVGIVTMSAGLSGMLGVWTSTTLVQRTTWHWTFLVPGVLGIALALRAGGLPSVKRLKVRDVDWIGGVLLSGALTFLLLGFSHLHEGPETFQDGAPYHLSMHLTSLALFAAFLWRQLRAPRPLLDLRVLNNTRLTAGVIANGIAHSSMLATSLLIPFLLEGGRGYTPAETAQVVLTQQVSMIVAAFVGGWVYSRRGTPALGVASLAAIACGLALLGQVGAQLPYPALFPVVAVLGAGLGIFTTVNNTAIVGSVRADERGLATGLVETTRQLGHSLGVSLSSSVLATALVTAAVPMVGYREGFSSAASLMGMVAAAGVVAVLYPVVRPRISHRISGSTLPPDTITPMR